MHRWPDADVVLPAAEAWARHLAGKVGGVLAVGVFGSYARGEAGHGSDLDLVVIVRDDPDMPTADDRRWAMEDLPVPAERLVYTLAQWSRLRRGNCRFFRTLREEARWLVGGPPK